MLRVDKLTVCYGQMQALRTVSMEISPGEMVALIGGNRRRQADRHRQLVAPDGSVC